VGLLDIKYGVIIGNKREHVKGNHPQKPKKLLDLAKEILRRKHYSIRTEEAYIGWMVRYIHFHNKRHSENMGAPEIEAFLTHLAVEGNVAGSTRNQAFNAILFLIGTF